MTNIALFNEISELPDNLKEEVADFVGFLELKLKKDKEPTKPKKREFGIGKGAFVMSSDFDEPLEDFKDYM